MVTVTVRLRVMFDEVTQHEQARALIHTDNSNYMYNKVKLPSQICLRTKSSDIKS